MGINKKTGPASKKLDCEGVAGLGSKLSAVYFGDFEGAFFDTFMNVAKSNEVFEFFHAGGDCAATHGAKAHGISVFRNFDNSPVHFDGEHNEDSVVAFLDKASVPTLIVFSDDASAPYNAVFQQAAEQLNGEILFVTSGTQ